MYFQVKKLLEFRPILRRNLPADKRLSQTRLLKKVRTLNSHVCGKMTLSKLLFLGDNFYLVTVTKKIVIVTGKL